MALPVAILVNLEGEIPSKMLFSEALGSVEFALLDFELGRDPSSFSSLQRLSLLEWEIFFAYFTHNLPDFSGSNCRGFCLSDSRQASHPYLILKRPWTLDSRFDAEMQGWILHESRT